MLRITQNSQSGRAKSYYSTADYYSEGQELTGRWRGEGAHRLGLSGDVKQPEWDALCDNIHPQTGQPLTPRRKADRTVGYDFNFHVPKSVSLLYAISRDERLLDAFRDAVDGTMHDMESEVSARVRKGGKNEERRTGNLAWGEFIHFTARPLDGVPDPHLHAHCFVFNATFDAKEDTWKAGQFRDIVRDAPYFEAVFHSRLASRLADLGLPIARTKHGWELAGVTKSLVNKFSRRTALIEDLAKEKGIDDPEAKSELGAKTREKKAKNLTLPELQTIWRERMSPQEQDALAALERKLGGDADKPDATAAARAMEYAIGHIFERKSVVPERELLATALKHSVGEASVEQVLRQVDAHSVITGERKGRRMATTREVLGEEQKIIDYAKRGRGQYKPFAKGRDKFSRDWLNKSQKAAVQHILESRDKVTIIRGAAGVGKTTLMQEAVEAIEESGTKVFAFAPSADASRGVLRAAGFKEADTVARLLLDEKLQQQAKGQLIWIDEAGLLGTKTMSDVFALAAKLDARVLLTGDRKQHGSVERGAALRILEEEAGIKPAEVKEIQRQSDAYKAAVKSLSDGKTSEGFERLDSLGWVREIASEDRYLQMAADYVAAVKSGQTALVVSPTHSEGHRITAEIRDALRKSKSISGEEREFRTLENARLTEAERTDAINYAPGDVLQFHQNAKGFNRGQRIAVAGAKQLPLNQAARFQVFHSATLRLSKGDRVRITHNGMTADGQHRLDNGSLYTVKSFDRSGNIILKENNWTISKDFGHIEHGYVVTSYASQGKSVERVLIGQSSASFPASSREQFYVSVSRGSKQATIYTDSKAALREAVGQTEERVSATELVNQTATRQIVARQQELERISALQKPREREGLNHER
jgi:conjugative relaxase-like TrwC/TraI family protein